MGRGHENRRNDGESASRGEQSVSHLFDHNTSSSVNDEHRFSPDGKIVSRIGRPVRQARRCVEIQLHVSAREPVQRDVKGNPLTIVPPARVEVAAVQFVAFASGRDSYLKNDAVSRAGPRRRQQSY
jgi:hypothetical protein